MRFALIALLAACGPSTLPCPVPPVGPPPALPAPPGFTVRRCPASAWSSPRASELVAERAGARAATSDEIVAFNQRHARELLADGVTGVGVGGCCLGGPARLCLVVYAEADTPGASDLLARIDHLIQQDGTPELGLPTKIDLSPPRHPRCAASDPACGPISYDHACAPRDSLPHRAPVRTPDIDPRNVCSHDGECFQNGCGNQCTSYRQGSMVGTCEYSTLLEPAWCGCVRGRCAWFR